MAGNAPNISDVRAAIDVYLEHAYGEAEPSHAVAAVVTTLQRAGDVEFLGLPVWERDHAEPACQYLLRLGNRFYPHMKLVLDRRPDGLGYVFRVDGHDRHVLASSAGGACEAFQEIVRQDAAIANAIENAWERRGLMTMRQFSASHVDQFDHITSI